MTTITSFFWRDHLKRQLKTVVDNRRLQIDMMEAGRPPLLEEKLLSSARGAVAWTR
ncbi:hypothetical protein CU097_003231, partial [Rhizopus azygosporus]